MAHLMQRAGRPSPTRMWQDTAAHALSGPCYHPRHPECCAPEPPNHCFRRPRRDRLRCHSGCTMRPHFVVVTRTHSLPYCSSNHQPITQPGLLCRPRSQSAERSAKPAGDECMTRGHRRVKARDGSRSLRVESPSPCRRTVKCVVPVSRSSTAVHKEPFFGKKKINPERMNPASPGLPRAGKPTPRGYSVADSLGAAPSTTPREADQASHTRSPWDIQVTLQHDCGDTVEPLCCSVPRYCEVHNIRRTACCDEQLMCCKPTVCSKPVSRPVCCKPTVCCKPVLQPAVPRCGVLGDGHHDNRGDGCHDNKGYGCHDNRGDNNCVGLVVPPPVCCQITCSCEPGRQSESLTAVQNPYRSSKYPPTKAPPQRRASRSSPITPRRQPPDPGAKVTPPVKVTPGLPPLPLREPIEEVPVMRRDDPPRHEMDSFPETPYVRPELQETPYSQPERQESPYNSPQRQESPYNSPERQESPYNSPERQESPYTRPFVPETPFIKQEWQEPPYTEPELQETPYHEPEIQAPEPPTQPAWEPSKYRTPHPSPYEAQDEPINKAPEVPINQRTETPKTPKHPEPDPRVRVPSEQYTIYDIPETVKSDLIPDKQPYPSLPQMSYNCCRFPPRRYCPPVLPPMSFYCQRSPPINNVCAIPSGSYCKQSSPTNPCCPTSPTTGSFCPKSPPTGSFCPKSPTTGSFCPRSPLTRSYCSQLPPSGFGFCSAKLPPSGSVCGKLQPSDVLCGGPRASSSNCEMLPSPTSYVFGGRQFPDRPGRCRGKKGSTNGNKSQGAAVTYSFKKRKCSKIKT